MKKLLSIFKRKPSEPKLASGAVSGLAHLEPPESLDEAVRLYKCAIVEQINSCPESMLEQELTRATREGLRHGYIKTQSACGGHLSLTPQDLDQMSLIAREKRKPLEARLRELLGNQE